MYTSVLGAAPNDIINTHITITHKHAKGPSHRKHKQLKQSTLHTIQ